MKANQSPSGKVVFECDYTKTPEAKIDHYGADAKMAADIASCLHSEINKLPVSIIEALEASVSTLTIDEARQTGQVVNLSDY